MYMWVSRGREEGLWILPFVPHTSFQGFPKLRHERACFIVIDALMFKIVFCLLQEILVCHTPCTAAKFPFKAHLHKLKDQI